MSLLDKTNLLITPNAVKVGKLYSVIPSSGLGDCTVVRNTTATRINNLGFIENVSANVPRVSYLTAGGNSFLLVEPQRTNLLLKSIDFSVGNWTKASSSIVPNNHISPDNTVNASKLIASSGTNNFIELFQLTTASQGTLLCQSYFVKKAEIGFCQITGPGSVFSGFFVNFDLNLGIVSSFFKDGLTTLIYGIEPAANGYFRIFVIANCLNTSNVTRLALNLIKTGTTGRGAAETFNGTDGLYVWGADLQVGSTLTSFIPTDSAAVTRNADVITVSPPAGTVKITTTFSDNTTQVITSIPALFTVPDGLIKQVLMQSSL